MESKHTKGKLSLQGPKIQADFGDQTYYTFLIKERIDALGFFYPKSPNPIEQMQSDAEKIVECWNNYDALKKENKRLKTALKKLIDTATETTSDLIAFDGAAQLDNAIDFAKNVLTQSTVKEDGNNEKQAL